MAKFNFIATDASGKEVRSSIEAASQAQAIAAIRAKNLFPTAIGMVDETKSTSAAPKKAKKGGMGMEIKLPKFLRPKVKQKDLTMFTRQLSTLMAAGMPLLRSLLVLERQSTNQTLKDILHEMGESVKS
ncbi:MAG: type II secretion system F family protein, partial [Kiritimatiellae bacterium]|nr:type II secretion system F family protein [Kiritimatiellia bacterium]